MKNRLVLTAIAVAALAACSGTGVAYRQATQNLAVQANPEPQTIVVQTTGGDGSPIRLSPLSSDDIASADLGGELACSFADDAGAILLLAMGIVASQERAFGIVKVADSIESVSAPGGFDGMIRGATFVGKGKTLVVERTSPEPVGGGESPPYPATLTYQRADGASRTLGGLWTCGP